ncbi:MAG: protoporphyrinogen/coproporphyrinogen oxidase [Actinomycetota bacterium]|nr:protoporphyrinogen/coproporphyrinogen oxidase [Actinomycetota bacterium]
MTATARHVAVVGGGISGLAAAHALTTAGVRVTVLEGADQVGGKLAVSDVAGLPVDEGAESLLARRPEGLELVRAVGLGDVLRDAATTTAAIWSKGVFRPVPAGSVMGVPGDLRTLAASRLLTTAELARIPIDTWLPRTRLGEDVSVGSYVARRMGRAVVDRLVDPLLGGVYAGRADELSLAATLPQLATLARERRSLLSAVREARDRAAHEQQGGPVFASLRGGLGRLPGAVAAASGAMIRCGAVVRRMDRTAAGWSLTVGSAHDARRVEVDGVVLAVPPAPAARLLRHPVPVAAAELSAVRTASVAVLALAFASGTPGLPESGSGYLVPPADGRLVKAATYTTNKWGWYAAEHPDVAVIRMSVGRIDDEADLQRDDDELVEAALADLADALGVQTPPLDARVSRWGGGLPQYAVGHLGRVERIRAAVAREPGLAVCGATYDGIGIPACIASARAAVSGLLGQWGHD